VSDTTIRSILKERKIYKGLILATDDEIIKTYKKTKKISETHKILKCSGDRVAKVLKKHGIKQSITCNRIQMGEKFHYLTVIGEGKPSRTSGGASKRILICKCECGNIVERSSSRLRGKAKSCGCKKKIINRYYPLQDPEYIEMKKLEKEVKVVMVKIRKWEKQQKRIEYENKMDEKRLKVGDKKDRWTILENLSRPESKSVKGSDKIKVKCECGTIKDHTGTALKTSKSCGCYAIDQSSKRGMFYGGENKKEKQLMYARWKNMRKRCYNIDSQQYINYGMRGISVCDRWLEPDGQGFRNFYEDMGDRPSKEYSLDRINNDGNYEPSNCRWATAKQQRNNQRKGIKRKKILIHKSYMIEDPF